MKKRRNKRRVNTTVLVVLIVLTLILIAGLGFLLLTSERAKSAPSGKGGYPLYISEVMAFNSTCPREDGLLTDWVEICNTGRKDTDLGGYFLSDTAGEGKYAIPRGTIVPAGGYAVIYCDAEIEGCAPFSLKRDGGETVCLMTPNRVAVSTVTTLPSLKNRTTAYGPDGTATADADPTPGFDNTPEGAAAFAAILQSRVSGELRLNEVMTTNHLVPDPDGEFFDWVELYNPSDKPVALSGWKLSDAEEETKYELPADELLGAGEYYIVYCTRDKVGPSYAPFGLSNAGGEILVLTGPTGIAADTLPLPGTAKNHSLAFNGSTWEETEKITPGLPNTDAGYEEYMGSGAQPYTGLYISEAAHKNIAGIRDEDGDFSDWIEIGNCSGGVIDLAGWSLSDNEDEPSKWTFPERSLKPGELLLVFADGKNRTGSELHTGFSLSEGETVVLSGPNGIPAASMSLKHLDGGKSRCGDADGNVTDTAFPTPGQENSIAGYEAWASSDKRESPILINEVMVANSTVGWSDYSGYCDWIELKNVSNAPVNLADYYLSDKDDQLNLWQLPSVTLQPGELITYYCTDEQVTDWGRTFTNFNLNASKEDLYLSDASGRLMDWVFLRDIPLEGSCGRMDGENGFFYFSKPSLNQRNAGGVRAVCDMPEATLPAGVYNDVTGLTLELKGAGEIRYTTDSSTPNAGSALYTGPITIDKTTIIRAACFGDNQLQSDTLTLSYIVNENHTLPVVSLVSDNGNLFGRGLYDNHEVANDQDWERPGSFAFFEEDGSVVLDCGIQIHGTTSRRASDKRSLKIRFRGKYDGKLDYDIFGDGEITEFSSLILRASLEDGYTSYMRDVLFAKLAREHTEVPAQNYRFCVLYINGRYWGLYAVREHHTPNYFASHYGVDANTVEKLSGYSRGNGGWNSLLTYAETHNLAVPESYQYLQDHLDIEEMIQWMILEIYSGNSDVNENVRFYSSPEYKDGRFIYGLTDMDLTLDTHFLGFRIGFYAWDQFGNPQLSGVIPERLLYSGNTEFRDLFLQRMGEAMQTWLRPEAVLADLDELIQEIEPETARDLQRWGQAANTFQAKIDKITGYINVRNDDLFNDAIRFFGLSADQVRAYFGN